MQSYKTAVSDFCEAVAFAATRSPSVSDWKLLAALHSLSVRRISQNLQCVSRLFFITNLNLKTVCVRSCALETVCTIEVAVHLFRQASRTRSRIRLFRSTVNWSLSQLDSTGSTRWVPGRGSTLSDRSGTLSVSCHLWSHKHFLLFAF